MKRIQEWKLPNKTKGIVGKGEVWDGVGRWGWGWGYRGEHWVGSLSRKDKSFRIKENLFSIDRRVFDKGLTRGRIYRGISMKNRQFL